MKTLLNQLTQHQQLTKESAKEVLTQIAHGQYSESEIAAFLTVYMMRSISIEELAGFRDALLELCIPIDLSAYTPIDLCGTGGDGKDTFNISTLASFVTAGAGIHVAKHGNYGVSSACGSSNVLEALGIKFSADEVFLRSCIEKAGICVLHAPLFHPAMKQVAPVRRSLGVKTFFNMLGPMVNPSRPNYQLVGVFQLELARMYQYLYQKDQIKYTIVHALDGYDEISLTGSAKIITPQGESLLSPQDFKAQLWRMGDITGGNGVEDAAKIFLEVLKGQGTQAQNEVVCANAALAISTVKGCSIAHAVDLAGESLKSGRAYESFIELQNISKSWIS